MAGDPDIIVGKALRAEPAQRYASVDQFAADLRRHLAGRPIAAHPESAGYRVRKFLGRHPAFLPGLFAVVLAVATFIGVLARQNRRLVGERDLAAAALRRARETQGFFVDLFRSPDPWAPADSARGRNITVLEALQLGATRVQQELSDQPSLRAALLSTIGGVLLSLDQLGDARRRSRRRWRCEPGPAPSERRSSRIISAGPGPAWTVSTSLTGPKGADPQTSAGARPGPPRSGPAEPGPPRPRSELLADRAPHRGSDPARGGCAGAP